MTSLDGLPGAEMIAAGLRDLDAGVRSIPALLVSIGSPRLRAAGMVVARVEINPERALYEALAQEDSDSAHSRYNALIRRLVSFERVLACAD